MWCDLTVYVVTCVAFSAYFDTKGAPIYDLHKMIEPNHIQTHTMPNHNILDIHTRY